MDKNIFNNRLLEFLNSSPTPFHAVLNMSKMLEDAGFKKLQEQERWNLTIGEKYYVTRGESAIIGFIYEETFSYNIIGAHTDSPTLKIKPNSKIYKEGVSQLGVEPYGGILLNPWFDRDLSIAGRVHFMLRDGTSSSKIIDFQKPMAFIPSLAIHLDSSANENRSINKQTDIVPLVSPSKSFDFNDKLLQLLGDEATEILSYDLSLYDTNLASYVGLDDEFIMGARLDNLLSCYTAVQALCVAQKPMMIVCNDHEEVGSTSAYGADGSFLSDVIQRIYKEVEERVMFARSSLFISADNAHAIHPNFPQKHEPMYAPKLGEGVVIKINANQRYASNAKTIAQVLEKTGKNGIKTQQFLTRSDMGCGSTIGPMTAAKLGIDTIDLGVPTYAMHSIRESCGTQDAYELYKLFLVM